VNEGKGQSEEQAAEKHIRVLCVDVGALGKELVDEGQMAICSSKVKGGRVMLRWGGAERSVRG
jgi:uncharacterized hydantoinase/oxoprolinase family protein